MNLVKVLFTDPSKWPATYVPPLDEVPAEPLPEIGEEDGDVTLYDGQDVADTSGDPITDDVTLLEAPTRRAFKEARGSAKASTAETIAILRQLGWRIRSTGELTQAVRSFQGGYGIGPALKVDGVVGPITTAAMRQSRARAEQRLPTASVYFSFSEFTCKCNGRYSACRRIWITREQVLEVTRYRAAVGRSVSIVSGCRCTGHNKDVGGVVGSMHLTGKASDFAPLHPPNWFKARRLFKGRGYNASNGLVRHGDMGRVRTWIYS